MTEIAGRSGCDRLDLVSAYCMRALPVAEMAEMEAHIGGCIECHRELDALRPVIDSLSAWPVDSLRPAASLWDRLLERISDQSQPAGASNQPQWREPEWEAVAPGIACKLLASDPQRDRVSMLVRLAPGAAYPPHTHADVEELHLLHGELWIDDRKLNPGDYNRAEVGTGDQRIWSETGCTCVLLTSTRDILR